MADELNELLNKQYRRYRNRMNFLTWYFGWAEKDFVRFMYGEWKIR